MQGSVIMVLSEHELVVHVVCKVLSCHDVGRMKVFLGAAAAGIEAIVIILIKQLQADK